MSAFEKITSDRQLQDHWLRRLVAAIIDYLIIWAVASIILTLARLPALFLNVAPSFVSPSELFQGVLLFVYAWLMEYSRSATLGKQIMNLRVTTTDGAALTADKVLFRNISKINNVLWLIDTLIGMALVGDPHQKYSDRWVGTTVTSTIDRGLFLPTPPSQPSPPSNV